MSKIKKKFQQSAAELRTTRCLTLTALLIALNVTMDLLNLRIQLTPELRVGFGFVCNAAIAMLFGPVVGMTAGFCTDVLGYLVNQGGGFYFPGYTLTAIVGGLLYGLWLYRPDEAVRGQLADSSRMSRILRVVGAKASVNLLCNIVLNTIWASVTGGKAMALLLPARAIKNIILLPLECIILFFVSEFVWMLYRSFAVAAKR